MIALAVPLLLWFVVASFWPNEEPAPKVSSVAPADDWHPPAPDDDDHPPAP